MQGCAWRCLWSNFLFSKDTVSWRKTTWPSSLSKLIPTLRPQIRAPAFESTHRPLAYLLLIGFSPSSTNVTMPAESAQGWGWGFSSLHFTLTNSNFTKDQMGSLSQEFRGDVLSPSSTMKGRVRSHISVTQPFCYVLTQNQGASRLTPRVRVWSVWGLEETSPLGLTFHICEMGPWTP